jgi:hypothetical protein
MDNVVVLRTCSESMSEHDSSSHYASLHCIDQNYNSLCENRNITKHGLTNHLHETSYARTSNYTKLADDRIGSWGSSVFVPARHNSLRDLNSHPMSRAQGANIPETNHYTMAWIEEQTGIINLIRFLIILVSFKAY